MPGLTAKKNEITIKLNTEELTATQVRLIKSVNSLISTVLTADEESEYFELSAELIKKTAELIKHAGFAEENRNMAYGEQAVEFSVDYLHETMEQNGLTNLDN